MDLSLDGSLHRVRSWVSGRVPSIPRRTFEKLRASIPWKTGKYKTRFLSGAFFLLALVLGVWANGIAEMEAISKWERNHLPSERIFKFALGSRGMHQVQDLNQLQKVMRSVPSRLDEMGSIWISTDANWAAYYSSPDQALQAQIYCLRCSNRPEKWKPLGIGWRGLEDALDEIDKNTLLSKPLAQKKKGRLPRDPRELIY